MAARRKTLRIATYNVNGIRARESNLLDWLARESPDIVCLQELKCMTDAFPYLEIEERGYNIAAVGEKTYNGVAILSKFPLSDTRVCLPGDEGDCQARYIESVATFPGGALRVASVYVPNGMSLDSDKFPYKLKFLERLHAHLSELLTYEEMLAIGGDYNVAPFPIDVPDPNRMDGAICYHPQERERLRAIFNLGMYDAYRTLYPTNQEYSWWDYRAGAFEANRGMRIDHILLSPQAADRLIGARIDHDVRAQEKASDHAPVLAELRLTNG